MGAAIQETKKKDFFVLKYEALRVKVRIALGRFFCIRNFDVSKC